MKWEPLLFAAVLLPGYALLVEEAFGKGRRKVGEAVKDLGNKIGR